MTKSINAITVRNIKSNTLIEAVGFDDGSDSIQLYISKNSISEDTKKMIIEEGHFEDCSENLFLETEAYHLPGTYGDVSIQIEAIQIS